MGGKVRIFLIILIFLFSLGTPVSAGNEIWVGADHDIISLTEAVKISGDGDVINIASGRYSVQDLKMEHDLSVIGHGEVIFYSPAKVRKGLIVPVTGTNIQIENIIFEGAQSPDENGAGIRFEGRSLEVRKSIFHNNENGILATGDPDSRVLVENSIFENNGFGDGYSHGIYMSHGATLMVQRSHFEGTKVGHHVKSVTSDRTIVTDSFFDDAEGRTSYVVDVTGGGDTVLVRNQIIRRGSADQRTLFNYDNSRGGELKPLTISENSILNYKRGVKLLRNPKRVNVSTLGNKVDLQNGLSVSIPKSPAGDQTQLRRLRDGVQYGRVNGAQSQNLMIEKVLVPEFRNTQKWERGLVRVPAFREPAQPNEIVGLNLVR